MKAVFHKEKSLAIAWDASRLEKPAAESFDAGFWKSRQALAGEAIGRGSAWFIDAPFGRAVLRRYLRGGWAAKLSRNRYVYTTVERSRPFKEFHLLADLYKLELPVPRPMAALCEHSGLFSTGAIMTARIEAAQTLADSLAGTGGGSEHKLWNSVGVCIRRFHDAGVWHADLNARNILLDPEGQVYLIDFDRAVYSPEKAVAGKNNLERLKRSLHKICMAKELPQMESAWVQLVRGYHG